MSPINRYDGIAIALHWLIAAGVALMLTLGFWGQLEPLGSFARFQVISWHKSTGVIVIVLVTVRLLWRWRHAPPAYAIPLDALEARLVPLVHRALYVLMIAVPLSGWLLASASTLNLPISIFGLVPWPRLPVPALGLSPEATEALIKDIHEALIWVLIGLVIVHFMGVLRHSIQKQDGMLQRMWPSTRGRS